MFRETFEFHTDKDTWWKYCILLSGSMHGHEWKLCESEERGNCLTPDDKLQIRICNMYRMTASDYCRFMVNLNLLALEQCLQEHSKSVWIPAVP